MIRTRSAPFMVGIPSGFMKFALMRKYPILYFSHSRCRGYVLNEELTSWIQGEDDAEDPVSSATNSACCGLEIMRDRLWK